MNILKFGCSSLKNVASGRFGNSYYGKILPEATFFKLEHSNLNIFISIMPLKTYFNEKFHFGDFDFLAFLSR